jgi:hypothetical protein
MRKLLMLICGGVLSGSLHAQMMIPITTTTRTPYGSFKTTTWTPTGHQYFGNSQISIKYPFTVTMKNDSVFTAKTRIRFEKDTHSIVVKDRAKDKQIIHPSETKEIYRIRENGKKMTGIPADSCWLFRCKEGKINAYSFLAEEGMTYATAIQKGDEGPIVPLTKANLLKMVGEEDPKVLRIIKENRLVRAIEVYNKEPKKSATKE